MEIHLNDVFLDELYYMKRINLLLGLLCSTFVACNSSKGIPASTTSLDQQALAQITASSFKSYVEKLSSDAFLGRLPFTKGDTLATDYIAAQFQALGLEAGNGDSYFQEVPMVEITSTATTSTLTIEGSAKPVTLTNLSDYVVGSRQLKETISLGKTPLVFAGFGIVAPEYNWNDYASLDVKGKIVVVMISDPGHYNKDLFKGDNMTYYGRWTYKYEEAARQGAAGVLIIHDSKAASYGWNVIRTGWAGAQMDLQSAASLQPYTPIEGWLSAPATTQLFEAAGYSNQLLEEAKKPGFKAVDLKLQTSIAVSNKLKKSTSRNVIAKITGSKRPDEVVVYTAHWDHLGTGEAVNGDSIYNGAQDNAAGVAALFEIAKAFKAAKVKPERSIILLAVTAEEQGLLGSAYYTSHPIYPLNKTVANINMDAFNPVGATSDLSIIGMGQSEMDDYLARSAAKFGRTVQAAGNPSSGGFYRSDHFNFAKVGVPALFAGSGKNYIDQDTVALNKRKEAFKGRYHAVTDELDENWTFEGILADIRVYFDLGYTLSSENTFPQWKAQSEFKEIGAKR